LPLAGKLVIPRGISVKKNYATNSVENPWNGEAAVCSIITWLSTYRFPWVFNNDSEGQLTNGLTE
jgi:hypothetical protein